MSKNYAAIYSVSKLEKVLAERNPQIARNIDFRRVIAEKNLTEQLESLSKEESRSHIIVIEDWVTNESEKEILYKKIGRLEYNN